MAYNFISGSVESEGSLGASTSMEAGTSVTAGTSFIIGSADVNETELEILDGATITTTELNYLDITTLGTVDSSKAVVADANKDITGFRSITASANVTLKDFLSTSRHTDCWWQVRVVTGLIRDGALYADSIEEVWGCGIR